MSASTIQATPATASPPAAIAYSPELSAISGMRVKSGARNIAPSRPYEASWEYFSSVIFRMKFDFSVVWNISLAIILDLSCPFGQKIIVSDSQKKLRTA